tara:strand:- start:46 stop:273 length:228 start_codon:yes stop_codon:yes gene_type:complete
MITLPDLLKRKRGTGDNTGIVSFALCDISTIRMAVKFYITSNHLVVASGKRDDYSRQNSNILRSCNFSALSLNEI